MTTFFQVRPLFSQRSVRADPGLSESCLLLLLHVSGTALHVPVSAQRGAVLGRHRTSRDQAKSSLFKLHGPTARASPAIKSLTIRDDDVKIIYV